MTNCALDREHGRKFIGARASIQPAADIAARTVAA
jgi:hypothetical protein